MTIDARGKLDQRPFTYRVTKDGKVMMSWQGRVVKTLAGKPAERLAAALAVASDDERQLLLAKATGQFKHGTEPRDR